MGFIQLEIVFYCRGIEFYIQNSVFEVQFRGHSGNWLAHNPLPGVDQMGLVIPWFQIKCLQHFLNGLANGLKIIVPHRYRSSRLLPVLSRHEPRPPSSTASPGQDWHQ